MNLRALLVNDASLAGHHGSALVTARCAALAKEAGIALTTGWDWPSVESALAGRHDFDLVIVNGEGSIHHDSKTAQRVAALATTLDAQGMRAYLVNASEEANSDRIVAGLAQFRLRYVRDRASQSSLAARGVTSIYVPDLTLTWPDAPAHAGGTGLLVTDASDKAVSQRLLALAHTWEGARAVSLRCAPPAPARGSRKRWIAWRVKQWLAAIRRDEAWTIRHAGAHPTLDAVAFAFAHEASGLVSGRYHAVCLALRIGLPFVAIEGNIGKISGLLEDAGLAHRLVLLEDLEARGAPPEIPPFSEEEKAKIAAFLSFAQEGAVAMFAEIAADARAPR
jgi:polysaccharide pyruvyl transferase WcaK-like protein